MAGFVHFWTSADTLDSSPARAHQIAARKVNFLFFNDVAHSQKLKAPFYTRKEQPGVGVKFSTLYIGSRKFLKVEHFLVSQTLRDPSWVHIFEAHVLFFIDAALS